MRSAYISVDDFWEDSGFYVRDEDGNLAHTSCVIPACAKFPFMDRMDYEIDPCYTYPAYRGKGIYPIVLHSICRELAENGSAFYMIVDERNASSIRGIEKAGFVRYGTVLKGKFTKRSIIWLGDLLRVGGRLRNGRVSIDHYAVV